MKIFVYKTIFVVILFYLLFEFTIGHQLRKFEKKIENYFTKENIANFRVKLDKELNNLSEKDRILTIEDAKKLRIIIDKLKNELKY